MGRWAGVSVRIVVGGGLLLAAAAAFAKDETDQPVVRATPEQRQRLLGNQAGAQHAQPTVTPAQRRQAIEEKWRQATPQEQERLLMKSSATRQQLLRAHPEIREEFLKRHPEFRGEFELQEQMAKLKTLSPGERAAFLKEHPEIREQMYKGQWDRATPEQRAAFFKDHPEISQTWEQMTPEQKRSFIQHLAAARKLAQGQQPNKASAPREGRPPVKPKVANPR